MKNAIFTLFLLLIGATLYADPKVEPRGNGWTLNTFDPTTLEPTTL